MSGWLLAAVFVISLGLVLYGWAQMLRLSFQLEKQRFGWADEEALQKFLSLRHRRGHGNDRRMRRYLSSDLRGHAEATGQDRVHRRARLALATGYAGALASAVAWFATQVLASGGAAR
ncbi:MAG: hypothetical protein Kow0026_24890 [Oricola sp.]